MFLGEFLREETQHQGAADAGHGGVAGMRNPRVAGLSRGAGSAMDGGVKGRFA